MKVILSAKIQSQIRRCDSSGFFWRLYYQKTLHARAPRKNLNFYLRNGREVSNLRSNRNFMIHIFSSECKHLHAPKLTYTGCFSFIKKSPWESLLRRHLITLSQLRLSQLHSLTVIKATQKSWRRTSLVISITMEPAMEKMTTWMEIDSTMHKMAIWTEMAS